MLLVIYKDRLIDLCRILSQILIYHLGNLFEMEWDTYSLQIGFVGKTDLYFAKEILI